MSEAAAADETAGQRRAGFLRRFWPLVGPFFFGKAGKAPPLLALGLLILTLFQVGVQVRFNIWNRDFFNALESRDYGAFMTQLGVFALLAVAAMVVAVYQIYTKQLIQLRWRAWLTDQLAGAWLEHGRHYQLNFMNDPGGDNPDQRIAEDARIATEMAVDFAGGILTSVIMLVSFVGILWTLSGPLHVALGSNEFAIPGYMVWAALIYAGAGSWVTWRLGKPMVDINVERNGREADFRFALVRLRESSEAVALIRGESDERQGLRRSFARIAVVWEALMHAQRRLMWLTSAYGSLVMVFPTLVASPRYFAGAITLGGLMQIVAAFTQVQASLNWFVDNFPKLAEWRSAVERVLSFQQAVEDVKRLAADPEQSTIEVVEGDGSELAFQNLQVSSSEGTVVVEGATARIERGERVLITGESGSGKSTLFRAVAGLWPWGSGRIVVPPRSRTMFLPQRPYLPLGTLRAVLAYPEPGTRYGDAALRNVLEHVGLAQLTDRLDEEHRWDQILSLGEQQRLAFARLLLQRPDWVFLDEATSALDEANQDAMMRLFEDELSGSGVVSIGHRPGLDRYHHRTLALQRAETGARLVVRRRNHAAGSRDSIARRMRRLFGRA